MLDAADLVAFVPTTDLGSARQFYEDTLGLRLLERTPFACVFQARNAVLRVTLVERAAGAPYTVLGWRVDDIVAAARELAARGIVPLSYDGLEQDELGAWRSPSGAHVVWFKDPAGNVLSLTEI